VELTIAKTKPDALFFACCVLGLGLGLRAYALRRVGPPAAPAPEAVSGVVAADAGPDLALDIPRGQAILVAARGVTPVLRFALDEARLRNGPLYVLYVKEVAVVFPGRIENLERPRWQDDQQAARIMAAALEQGRSTEVRVVPVYAVSDNPAATILDLSATLGIDILVLGSPHRNRLVALLKGNVVTEVARSLPESIQLLIYG
jgi:nucleotide-binding universal stress UspA family protein